MGMNNLPSEIHLSKTAKMTEVMELQLKKLKKMCIEKMATLNNS